jgi:putative endonuclease
VSPKTLELRVYEHKHKMGSEFTGKCDVRQLVHFELFKDIRNAIARQKRIQGWLRAKKMTLTESVNPNWVGLGADGYE